jgi:hypothetical protein
MVEYGTAHGTLSGDQMAALRPEREDAINDLVTALVAFKRSERARRKESSDTRRRACTDPRPVPYQPGSTVSVNLGRGIAEGDVGLVAHSRASYPRQAEDEEQL